MNLLDKEYAMENKLKAAFFKILINYSQCIAIINSLKLNWSEILLNLFQTQKVVSGSMHQAFSIECLIEGIFFDFSLCKLILLFYLISRFNIYLLL